MTKVTINGADSDFVTVKGNSPLNKVSNLRLNNFIGQDTALTDAHNDEIFFTRYFPKSGTYRVKYNYNKTANAGNTDVGLDSTRANDIFDNLAQWNSSSLVNQEKFTTISIARGFHDVHISNDSDGNVDDFDISFNFMHFDLISEHPVLGEERPAVENTGSMVLLGKYKAEKAESSHTFEFGDITKDKYSEIMIRTQGTNSSGSSTLKMTLNDSVTNYRRTSTLNNAGAGTPLTSSSTSSGTSWEILGTTILSTTNRYNAIVKLSQNAQNEITIISEGNAIYAGGHGGSQYGTGGSANNSFPLNKIKIELSSNWVADSTIEIYGVRKWIN